MAYLAMIYHKANSIEMSCYKHISQTLLLTFIDEYASKDRQRRHNQIFFGRQATLTENRSGNHKWAWSYFLMVLYNLMTSNNTESINATWVYQIDQSRYEVTNQMKNSIVNLQDRSCTFRKWKLLDIQCSHVMYNKWVKSYFAMETYRTIYSEVLFTVSIPFEYGQPNEVMIALLPLMGKQQADRLQSYNRIHSKVKV
uniref:Uncharacterized protein n=1 Tax=Lactuca sativa TaxID=4236 RepID=A0A9R1X188_LACSA|nr:hypothetical protein LSAT_V11C800408530 [Lactuca sativa]